MPPIYWYLDKAVVSASDS